MSNENPPCDIDRVNADLDRSAACLDACEGFAHPSQMRALIDEIMAAGRDESRVMMAARRLRRACGRA
jgi:hypothetical protein